MPIWLLNLIPILWRWLKHFAIYLLIALVLFGVPYLGYQYGWRKGYSQCTKDNPTYGHVGQVINNAGVQFRYAGAYLKLLIFDIKFGK